MSSGQVLQDPSRAIGKSIPQNQEIKFLQNSNPTKTSQKYLKQTIFLTISDGTPLAIHKKRKQYMGA